MKGAEHKPEEGSEDQGFNRTSAATKIGLAIAGTALFAASIAINVVTLDVPSLIDNVTSATSFIAKATGLSKLASAAGKRLGKSQVLDVAKKAWGVVTSKPVMTALKVVALGLALASAATPVGWAIAGISAAALVVGTVIGSVKAGRIKRFKEEAERADKELEKGGQELKVFQPQKGSALEALLNSKLKEAENPSFGLRKIGADASRLSLLEGTALIVSAVDAGPIGAVVAGAALLGGASGAGAEALDQKTEENELRAKRDATIAKVICAKLAARKGIDVTKMTEAQLAKEYKVEYDKYFPEKTGLARVGQVFKDMAHGIGPYFTNGLKKLFSKKEGHSNAQATTVASQGLTQAQDKAMQIPTHIEIESEHSPPPPAHHHVLDPNFMQTHTHIDTTEHGPHLGEGGGRVVTGVKSR